MFYVYSCFETNQAGKDGRNNTTSDDEAASSRRLHIDDDAAAAAVAGEQWCQPVLEERAICKANFWHASSVSSSAADIVMYETTNWLDEVAMDAAAAAASAVDNTNRQAAAARAKQTHSPSHRPGNNGIDQAPPLATCVASKLIELNLANNAFTKMPDCLSCLAPKLVKLNMSHNRLESMGAVCDLPLSLKFLDLVNNQIRRPMRLLNEHLLRLVVVYFAKYAPLSTTSAVAESPLPLNTLLADLLLENEFCYLNLAKKSLLTSSRPSPSPSSSSYVISSPPPSGHHHAFSQQQQQQQQQQQRSANRDNYSYNNNADLVVKSPSSASAAAKSARSTSKRRARSQSRSHHHRVALGGDTSSVVDRAGNTSAASNGNANANANNNNNPKRFMPFDLFLTNMRYNRAYSQAAAAAAATQAATTNYDESDALSPQSNQQQPHAAELSSEAELTKSERRLLNTQNLPIFLEQMCAHKRRKFTSYQH